MPNSRIMFELRTAHGRGNLECSLQMRTDSIQDAEDDRPPLIAGAASPTSVPHATSAE